MADKDLILAIDNGTQSLKALVFDPAGGLLAKSRVAFEPYVSPRPGWAEQDPEVFWSALCQACHTLWREEPGLKERLAGATLTTQRNTVINLDKDGKVLRPAIVWLDQRKSRDHAPPSGIMGLAARLPRVGTLIRHVQTEAKSNWLATNQPDIWANTAKYLMLSGFLTHRLTGRYVDSIGCQVGYVPFDYKRQQWYPPDNWHCQSLSIDLEQMPELVQPGQPLGQITRQAAEETGMPEGLTLIAAAADKACEVIGSGSLDPSVGCLSYSTTATINVTSKRYIEPVNLLPAYPSAAPGRYSLEWMIYRGFWMVSWFKEQFGYPECRTAEQAGMEPEELFDRMVEEVPPGCQGLMLQPYWTPGVRTPGAEAKGAVIGFGDVHTRAHLYRAILEGLAYGLREGKEHLEKRTKTPITRLVVSGGGSQSRVAMQATADIFNLPTSRPALYEASALGAAMDAAVGLGLHSDLEAAAQAMTRAGSTYEPRPEQARLYEQLFRQVYQKMYAKLKPLYMRIRDITGYPE